MDPIEGVKTAVVTIQTPLGPRELFLANAAYIPAFYTNLACLKKFNKKNI